MQRELKLTKETNPVVQRISDMLVKAFSEVGEKIREDLLKAYRAYALSSFKTFMKVISESTGRIKEDSYGRQQFHDWNEYADIKKESGYYSTSPRKTWEDYKKIAHLFEVSYRHADSRANESYENARDSFVHKNLDKIRNILGSRTDFKSGVIKFDWKGGYFKGNIQLYLEGAYFRGDVDIKYVIRTIPRVTPYFQYPLLFTEAEVGGKLYRSPSEDELRVLLGGVSKKESAEAARAAAIASGLCPMSGEPVPEALMAPVRGRVTPYVRCPQCKAVVSAQHSKFRAHKTPASEKAAEVRKLETAGYCPMSGQSAPFHLFEKLIRSYKTYPGGVEKTEYDFSIFDAQNKYRKLRCESCGQDVVLNDVRGAYSPEKVRAIYRKHKLTK